MSESAISDEFVRVPLCGGKANFEIKTIGETRVVSSFSYSFDRPLPARAMGVFVLPQGIPVGNDSLGWQGPNVPGPPTEDSITVIIASDVEMMWGRQCPRCRGYFRSSSAPFLWRMTCAYCGLKSSTHQFTTEMQKRYIRHYVHVLMTAAESDTDKVTIDLDAAAEAAVKGFETPKYYYDGEKQQLKFKCTACQQTTDVLGHYAYCSCCGTKNNSALFGESVEGICSQLQSSAKPSDLLKLIVSEFDGCCRNYIELVNAGVRQTKNRKERASRIKFHDVDRFSKELLEIYDIDVLSGLSADDVSFARLRFHRRHIYEHRGGIVDQDYISASGDQKRVGQQLNETISNIRTLGTITQRMVENIDKHFHEIFPPEDVALRVLGKNK